MTTRNKTLDKVDMEAWPALVNIGMAHAVSGLSEMVGQELKTTALSSKRVRVKDVSSMFGGPESLVVMIYVGIFGSAIGHLILIHQPQTAFDLVDMLLGAAPGSTQSLGEMELSALGEMGNIIASFFLTALADKTGLDLRPTPPAVMMEMAGAMLDGVLAEILLVHISHMAEYPSE